MSGAPPVDAAGAPGPSGLERLLIGVAVVVMVVAVDMSWMAKERLLREGTTVFLALAPVDPRSLMQGDYMALEYAVARSVSEVRGRRPLLSGLIFGGRSARSGEPWSEDGLMVVDTRASEGASFVRVDQGEALGPGEVRLRYRVRGSGTRVGTDAFYFEEGTAEVYAAARFGELRVDDDGESVLVGLADADRQPLGKRLE